MVSAVVKQANILVELSLTNFIINFFFLFDFLNVILNKVFFPLLFSNEFFSKILFVGVQTQLRWIIKAWRTFCCFLCQEKGKMHATSVARQ